MSGSAERHVDDRIRWAAGRTLRSRDLTGQALAAAQARGTHVLRAHRTWGVLAGFELVLSKRHDLVDVSPGVAYDACGREITLPGRTLEMPQGSAARDGSALVAHCGGCAWRTPDALRHGLDVPLAHLRVDGADVWLDGAGRRRCATQRRPVELYAGRRATSRDDWLGIDAGALACRVEPGIAAQSAPHWFATLEDGIDGSGPPAGLYLSLAEESATGFTVVVIPSSAGVAALLASRFSSTPPAIAWTAIGAQDDRP